MSPRVSASSIIFTDGLCTLDHYTLAASTLLSDIESCLEGFFKLAFRGYLQVSREYTLEDLIYFNSRAWKDKLNDSRLKCVPCYVESGPKAEEKFPRFIFFSPAL